MGNLRADNIPALIDPLMISSKKFSLIFKTITRIIAVVAQTGSSNDVNDINFNIKFIVT